MSPPEADRVRIARKQREPVRVYGGDAVELLTRCWAASDGPCGKRLHPVLGEVLDTWPGMVISITSTLR